MPSWSEFATVVPELAERVRARFDAHVHKTLATVRADGAPRISGTECKIAEGELWIGSMWEARKALDLRRDPRYALHSGSDDPPGWVGDAKVAGVVEEILDPEMVARLNGPAAELGPSHLFRLEIAEASVVELAPSGKAIVLDSWTPAGGLRRIERA